MKTLTIDDKDAKKLYPTASTEFKTVLESAFGKEFFSQKITDRVKTFEDACAIMGIQSTEVTSVYDEGDDIAYKKLKVVVAALNEGWTPDWNNNNQPKYYPWFELQGGFRLDGVDCGYALSYVGSRLCFKSRELAAYAGKQFEDLYKQFFTL